MPRPAGAGPAAGILPGRRRFVPPHARFATESRRERGIPPVPSCGRRTVTRVPPSDVRLEVAPYDYAAAERLGAALGVSHVTAQVLVRRGFGDPAAARAFLAAEARHPLDAFGGLRDGAAQILAHVERGSRITVHGDYDVDGVSATAVLVRALRTRGRGRRLVPPEPDRRRLRPGARHGRAARRPGHAAAGHGGLRDHRGRGGRRRARGRSRRRRHRSSRPARGRPPAGCADRAPAPGRLSVPGALRRRRGAPARAGAAGGGGDATRGRRRRPRPRRARHGRGLRAAGRREPAARARRACARSRRRASRGCRR